MIYKTNFEIKQDSPKYDNLVEEIYDICFGPGRFAKAAHLLREGNICNYELSKIIYDIAEKKIIGACRIWPIKFSKGGIGWFLGPIAILPQYRDFGLGGKLVQECIVENEKNQNLPIFLVGDLGFFSKFGFKNIPNKNMQFPSPVLQNRILYYGENIDFTNVFCGTIAPNSKQ